MFGAVSASLLMDLAKRGGYMQQLELLETVPFIEIDLQFLTSVPIKYSWRGGGYGLQRSIDHPCFTEIREKLYNGGYIHIEKGWSNGDRVLKPFYINRYLFDVGDKFCCASAQMYPISKFMETREYDRRDPDYFAYGGEFIPKGELQW